MSTLDDRSQLSFGDLCAVRDLEDLALESAACSMGDFCENTIGPVSLKARSDFYPVNFRTPDISRFKKMVEQDLTTLAHEVSEGALPWPDNLSEEERLALRNLEEDKSIVICNSDKGGLIVVMNVDSYLNETARQLSDSQTYV